jgi:hypothetical protein
MSDKQAGEATIFSEAEAKEIVEDLGFKSYDVPHYRWYQRLKCKVVGPHDWVPMLFYDVVLEEMTEGGTICERCHKEDRR